MNKPAQPKFKIASIADGVRQLEDAHNVLKVQLERTDDLNLKLADALNRATAANQAQWSAEKRLEDMRRQYEEVKFRLHTCELSLARSEGYMQRVKETDNSIAGPV